MTQERMEQIFHYLKKKESIRKLTGEYEGDETVDMMIKELYKGYLKLNRKYKSLQKELKELQIEEN